jgi:hypothetical protein
MPQIEAISPHRPAAFPPERPPDDTAASVRLLVFSDDWGRHPSSCQHLVGHLLPQCPTLWVNTIGSRRLRLTREDVGKAVGRCRSWLTGGLAGGGAPVPRNLAVISPLMYPGFRRPWQRRLNAARLGAAVNRAMHHHFGVWRDGAGREGAGRDGTRRVALTTIPTTADLIGRVDVDAWIYYAVDDFSVWPGLDGPVLDAMERQLAANVDAAAAVSTTIRQRLAAMGCVAELLTHGIEPGFWSQVEPSARAAATAELRGMAGRGPVLLFWGVVDRRLDVELCLRLAAEVGPLVFVGPQQNPDPRLIACPHIHLPGPRPLAALPALAAAAGVLVMPYADLLVTRAMQLLKLKEYLATGRPAVVRDLPATVDWSDCVDVACDAAAFIAAVRRRATEGITPAQSAARTARLPGESWADKACQLRMLVDHVIPQHPHG